MLRTVLDNPWVRAVAVVLGLIGLFFLVRLLSPVLVPLLMAFLVAYLLDPVVDFFEKRKIARGTTIAALAILGIIILVSIPLLVIPGIVREAHSLATSSPSGESSAGDGVFQEWLVRGVKVVHLDDLVRNLEWEEEGRDTLSILAEKTGEWVSENASGLLKTYAGQFASVGQQAGNTVAQLLASLGRGIVSVIVFFANFALFAFVAGYLLRDFDGIVAGCKKLVPPRYRSKTFDIVGRIDLQLRCFLRGQFIVCLCLGGMYAIGFLIAGTPFALLVALFGMVASFVPYVGVLLVSVTALFLTLLEHQLDWHLLAALATVVLAQALEGNVLTPRIVGNQVGLNPVWVILAVLVFGNFLGFVGLLLAVPIAAALKVLVVEGVAYYKRSSVFGTESSTSGASGDGDSS